MKVVALDARTCVVPYDKQIAMSKRTLRERQYALVRVRTDTGAEGIGFCYGGHKAGHLVTIAIRDLLRDVVLGQDPHQVEALWSAMYQEALLHGRRGIILRAMSAIDIALWDVVAKEAGLPLYQYLGAYRDEVVPAYASGGQYAEGETPEDLARELQICLDMGFRAVKMKVGGLPPAEDATRVRIAREAVGPNVHLFLDANNAWPDAHTAIQAIRHFEEYNPGWMEEPLMPDDIHGHAAVAAAIQMPVAMGEIHATRWEFRQLIEHKAASILQPDVGVCGGITEWRRIAALAAGNNIPVAPHWLAEVHVHLVASIPNAIWTEYDTDLRGGGVGRLFSTRLDIKSGGLALPQRPGLGVELDQAAVKCYSVDSWA